MKEYYKNEKAFQADYIKAMREDGWWVYKLPDVSYTLKPFDMICIKDGVSVAIELKYGRVDTYERIYKMLRPNQVGWLQHFKEHWGTSKIVWRDKKDNKSYEYDFNLIEYTWVL